MAMHWMQTILLLDILLAACCQDLLTDRVSNSLLIAGWGCGLITAIAALRWTVLADSLLGACLPIALFWVLFRFRMIGAGDIKLLSVCGIFLGVRSCLYAAAASIFCGGIIAAILILSRGNLSSRIHYFLTYLSQYLQEKTIQPYRRPEDKDALFHFTPAILGGVVWTLIFHLHI